MEMELSFQTSIMQAIQELQTLTLDANRGSVHLDTPAAEQSDADMKEALAQRCHELDTQVKTLHEEKMTLLSEVSRLTAARAAARSPELDEGGASIGPAHAGTLRYTNMRAQLDALKDELDKVELQRDDQHARADAAERELALYKLRNEELQMAATDELDALRETAAKAATLEAAVASYKKRMEEHVDLRRQVKLLEHAIEEHLQRAIEHDQAAVKANAVRAQLDIYKKQVTDLNEKLNAEITKADKLEIENKKLISRAMSLQRERDALNSILDEMADQGFLKPKRGFATVAVHSGKDPEKWSGAVVPPIVTSAVYKRTVHNHTGYIYGRSGNPTRTALEDCLAKLDGGIDAITFASGLAATTTIASLVSKGDHIISSDDLYGGTSRLFRDIIDRLGIDVSFVDCTSTENLAKALQKNTKMVWIETPTNPILRVLDIAEISKVIKSFGDILLVVDNTFLTPYLQRPLDLGADIAMCSLTKYMNGHSDVVMGAAVVKDEELGKRLHFLQKAMGAVPSPIDCYMVSRSLKTLPLRMEQHKKSSLVIAQWLQKHPKVTEVLHPGLPSHPQHEICKRQTSGHSGIFSFKHCGGIKESEALLHAFKVFTLAESLGGFESLAQLPALMTHASLPEEQRLKLGISDSLIRMSVGLEDIDDLLEDLEQAFNVAFP